MPVALLASRMGVDRSTLVSWLMTDRQPQPLQLLLLTHVTDLPLTELAAAADVPLERVLKQRAVLFDYVSWELGRSGAIPDEERQGLVTFLQRVRDASTSAVDTPETPSGEAADEENRSADQGRPHRG